MDNYLRETKLLDYNHPALRGLIAEQGWAGLDPFEAIGAAYGFVKDEIVFGYNAADDIPASEVLADHHGQCNTKTTLFMALLRALGVPCRFHGFTIHKDLQKGAVSGLLYRLAPKEIIHSWAEVRLGDRWLNLEGLILDRAYLESMQQRFASSSKAFCGFAIATDDLANPGVEWTGTDTYIQREGIARDLGVWDCPDDFYAQHGSNLGGLKDFIFRRRGRAMLNRRIAHLRQGD